MSDHAVSDHTASDRAGSDHTGSDHTGSDCTGSDHRESGTASLIRMANQIAANVAHHPRDQAVTEIAKHLQTTWAPSMRADLAAYVDGGGLDLTPLAAAAAEQLRIAEPLRTADTKL